MQDLRKRVHKIQNAIMPRGVRARKQHAQIWSAILSSLVLGMLFGSVGSLLVNCALVEISLSPLFATAFGVLFLISGGTVAWQVLLEPDGGENRMLLLAFSALVTTSGILCFLLERDWSHGLSRRAKVPLYALLGVSLSFSTHFTALDLLARMRESLGWNSMHGGPVNAMVRTQWQARLLALVAVVTGCLYGLVFGIMDVEDAHKGRELRVALQRETRVCYPIGAVAGALAAIAARVLELRGLDGDVELRYLTAAGDDL